MRIPPISDDYEIGLIEASTFHFNCLRGGGIQRSANFVEVMNDGDDEMGCHWTQRVADNCIHGVGERDAPTSNPPTRRRIRYLS